MKIYIYKVQTLYRVFIWILTREIFILSLTWKLSFFVFYLFVVYYLRNTQLRVCLVQRKLIFKITFWIYKCLGWGKMLVNQKLFFSWL